MVIIGCGLTTGGISGGHAAAVGQAQIHDRRVGVEFLAEAVGDHFKRGQQCAILESDTGQQAGSDPALRSRPMPSGFTMISEMDLGFKQMLESVSEMG